MRLTHSDINSNHELHTHNSSSGSLRQTPATAKIHAFKPASERTNNHTGLLWGAGQAKQGSLGKTETLQGLCAAGAPLVKELHRCIRQ